MGRIVTAVLFAVLTMPAPGGASEGDRDPSFGTGGAVITQVGTGSSGGNAVAVQADRKIVAAGAAYNGSSGFALVRYAVNGALDAAFGNGGTVITPIGTAAGAIAVVIQNDGKSLVGRAGR
ncbi:MAG: hypothetical protein E6J72_08075 [Deltaproteobacteria bacterium]|nr:MAG: hypothetical protein E6J72_08075 [Deltaproteobacteria bacterium]